MEKLRTVITSGSQNGSAIAVAGHSFILAAWNVKLENRIVIFGFTLPFFIYDYKIYTKICSTV